MNKANEIREKMDKIINRKANTIDDIVMLSRLNYGYSIEIERIGKELGQLERNYNLVRSQMASDLAKDMPASKANIDAKNIAEEKYGDYQEKFRRFQGMRYISDKVDSFISVSQQAIKLQMNATDYLPSKK